MTRTGEVFRFELAYQFGRASTLVYFLIVLGILTPFLQMMSNGSSLDGTHFNSPFALMVAVVFGSMLALLIVAAFAGDAATRDVDVRMDSLFYTSPIGKRAYVAGRFLGAFAMSALLFLALPVGAIAATWMPWVDRETLGPFSLSAYLAPYVFFALPNAFVATAVLFGAAALARRAIASYAGAAFLFFFSMVCGKVLAPRMGWSVARLLDPLGYTTSLELWKSTNALQKNAFAIALDGPLLSNRLLWVGVGLAVLTLAYARFRMAHETAGSGWTLLRSKALDDASGSEIRRIAVPAPRRVFDASTRVRQLVAIAARSFRELHTSRAWWIVPFVVLLFIQAAPELARLEVGIPGPLTTARLVGFLSGDTSIFFTLLIALSAGELVWRERGARMHSIAGVTPVPDWITVTGKFAGLAMMLATTMLIFMLAGLAAQAVVGTERYDIRLYIEILFGLQLPEYLLIAALAMIVHVLVNQKYVANVLVAPLPIAIDVLESLGVQNDLLLYGSLPSWAYSEIRGFGLTLESRLWFTLYFAGWALLFALVTYLFWIRGEEDGVRQRLAIARRRLTAPAMAFGAVALAVIGGAGGFIFYNTHILSDYVTKAESERRYAEFERRYRRYASLPQPLLTAVKLHVDFYPRNRTATIRGSYGLRNHTDARIESIHIVTSSLPEETKVSFDRPSRVSLDDEDRGYAIYDLERPLEPGESLRMHFEVAIRSRLFQKYGNPPVIENGSLILHRPGQAGHWLPLVGYQASSELDHPVVRKRYGLPERPQYPQLSDVSLRHEHRGNERIELETIIGTDGDQIGVAPGEMRRTWMENGRRYVHYRTGAPVRNVWTIASANYAVHRAKWENPSAGAGQDVDIEIFHHPSHTKNLARLVHGVQASLTYNTKHFGPYRHRLVRLVETPSSPYWLQMSAFGGFITYAETFALVRPEDDPRNIDFPFAVMAHEMAHQWWGHQLRPAVVEGGPFLAESLAWYTGMLVVEETFGRDHLERILGMMRAQYLAPNQPRRFPLLRAVDPLDSYRTGPFAMYALREAVGVDVVNGALRSFLAKFPTHRPPYPTSLDFYAELRAATPPSMHSLLKDLFEDITLWELRAEGMDVEAAANGTYRVMLRIEAAKLKGDGKGNQQPFPMNDPIEIGVYDAEGRLLYSGRHRIRSGMQTIEIVVTRKPVRAVIDPDHELIDRKPEDNEVTTMR